MKILGKATKSSAYVVECENLGGMKASDGVFFDGGDEAGCSATRAVITLSQPHATHCIPPTLLFEISLSRNLTV